METRKRLAAALAAAALTLGIAGIALAEDLNPGQVGQTLGGFEGNAEECEEFPFEIGDGEVGVHFVLTDPEASSGNLDATFSNPASSITGLANTPHPSTTLHWHAVITGDANTVLVSASTDVDGGNLNLSHACFPEEAPSEPPVTEPPVTEPPITEAPSFEQSEDPETDAPSEPVITEAPSFEQSQEVESEAPSEPTITEAPSEPVITKPPCPEVDIQGLEEDPCVSPSFVQSQEGETDVPSEPNTATIGSGHGSSGPADSAWLLVVALGMLLASIVVLTPARAKTRR